MKSIEATGKKLNDAINAGLQELGLTLDDVDVEILESGGFFKKAKVRLTVIEQDEVPTEQPEEQATEEDVAQPLAAAEQFPAADEKASKEHAEAPAVRKLEQDKPKREKTERKEKKPFVKKPLPPKEEKEYPPATEEQVAKAKCYVEGLLQVMHVEGTVSVSLEKNVVKVDIDTENAMVIGHRGETLDAIQVLTKRAIERDEDKYLRVVADCNGYRAKREASLISLAHKTADKCVKRGRKVALEPMDSAQRKIIHSALTDDDRVFTRSDGKEPNRRVVVFPNYARRKSDEE